MSTEELNLYAAYGVGQHLSLWLCSDDRLEFQLAGNTTPLFPPAEMGSYAGVAGGLAAELLAAARAVIVAEPGPRAFRPDSAICSATLTRGAEEVELVQALYEPLARWAPLQKRFFELVNGPWRALRRQTLAMSARWTAGQVVGDQLPSAVFTFTNSGTAPLSVTDPGDPLRWAPRLLPRGLSAEARAAFRGSFAPAEWKLDGPAARAAIRRLDPGATLEYRIDFARAVPPGDYELLVDFRADPVPPRAPPDRIGGVLRPELGAVTVRG